MVLHTVTQTYRFLSLSLSVLLFVFVCFFWHTVSLPTVYFSLPVKRQKLMFCQSLTVVYVCQSQPFLEGGRSEKESSTLSSLQLRIPRSRIILFRWKLFVTFLSKLAYLPLSSETNKLWNWMYLSIKLKLTAVCQMTTASSGI